MLTGGQAEETSGGEAEGIRRQRRRIDDTAVGHSSSTRGAGHLWLVLGDGNLSYSAALVAASASRCIGEKLIATTLESGEDLHRRYGADAVSKRLTVLSTARARVLHGVDATCLRQTLLPRLKPEDDLAAGHELDGLFERIIFNFPHVVGGLKAQRNLLEKFLCEAAPLLAAGGAIDVALCAGQGGTPADGERRRPWGNHWRVVLHAARAGLALVAAVPWSPPDAFAGSKEEAVTARKRRADANDAPLSLVYESAREPGNRGAGKSFNTEGAVLHTFARARMAEPCHRRFPSGDTGKVPPGYEAVANMVIAALREPGQELSFEGFSCQLLGAPGVHGIAGASCPPVRPRVRCVLRWSCVNDGKAIESSGSAESSRKHAGSSLGRLEAWLSDMMVRMADGSQRVLLEECVRWADQQAMNAEVVHSVRALEVCLPRVSALAFADAENLPTGDWHVAAQISCDSNTSMVWVDMEVVAMLRAGVTDRRLLKCSAEPAPSCVHPYTYIYLLRLASAASLDGVAVLTVVESICGDLLFEASEIPADCNESWPRSGERRWRIALNSVAADAVLDDRAAYALYQRVRLDVAKALGAELA